MKDLSYNLFLNVVIVIGGRNIALNVMQCFTTSRPIFHYPNAYSLTGKFELLGYVEVRPRSYSYLVNLSQFLNSQALLRTPVLLTSKAHQLSWLKTKYSDFVKYVLNRLLNHNGVL